MKNLKFTIEKELQHYGICDASGALAIDIERFIVATDEDNLLRVYCASTSGESLQHIDINSYFTNNPQQKEVDIEAAAELNGLCYWITSHGRNKKGKQKPERHQFFATVIDKSTEQLIKQVGKSYTKLVFEDILKSNINLEQAEQLAPKEKGGLNIEGLTATPEGELLLGFRNPIPNNKALLLPLKNPQELIEKPETEVKANFGEIIQLDLQGLGIRSIEYWAAYQVYIIIAGAYDGSANFKLYWWTGNPLDNPTPFESINLPADFRPEAVLFYPEKKDYLQLLSDDGTIIRADGIQCKDIEDKNHPQKFFRSLIVKVN